MALSDCSKCWDTSCTCGYEYRNYSEDQIINWINNILGYHNKEEILKKLVKENNNKV